MADLMSANRFGEPSEGVAALAAAGFDDGQQTFDELAPRSRLRAERQLSPNHRVAQRLLGRVVGRLSDAVVVHEGPQVVFVFDEFLAKAVRQRGCSNRARQSASIF